LEKKNTNARAQTLSMTQGGGDWQKGFFRWAGGERGETRVDGTRWGKKGGREK